MKYHVDFVRNLHWTRLKKTAAYGCCRGKYVRCKNIRQHV